MTIMRTKLPMVSNSRARLLRVVDADVRAEVTGDPPEIILDDAAFGPGCSLKDLAQRRGESEEVALRKNPIGLCLETCAVSGVIVSVAPVYEADAEEVPLPLPTYQRELIGEGGAQ